MKNGQELRAVLGEVACFNKKKKEKKGWDIPDPEHAWDIVFVFQLSGLTKAIRIVSPPFGESKTISDGSRAVWR